MGKESRAGVRPTGMSGEGARNLSFYSHLSLTVYVTIDKIGVEIVLNVKMVCDAVKQCKEDHRQTCSKQNPKVV